MKPFLEEEWRIIPVFSKNSCTMDTRFGKADTFVEKIQELTGEEGIADITGAEVVGPQKLFDLMIISPCTGNTLAKLANGIVDGAVLMAAKAHLRNERPLLIGISTNDAMGLNFKNIGLLYNQKNIYFIPFGQDDAIKKPNSLISHTDIILPAAKQALLGKQLQPALKEYKTTE